MPDRPLQLYDVQRNSEQCGPKHSPDPQRRINAFDLQKAALNLTDAFFWIAGRRFARLFCPEESSLLFEQYVLFETYVGVSKQPNA